MEDSDMIFGNQQQQQLPLDSPAGKMDAISADTGIQQSIAVIDKNISSVTLPSKSQDQENQSQQQQESVDQILRFWNHPALQHVAPSEKEDYLMTQKGITKDQIYRAWDQLLATPVTQKEGNSSNGATTHENQQQQQRPSNAPSHPAAKATDPTTNSLNNSGSTPHTPQQPHHPPVSSSMPPPPPPPHSYPYQPPPPPYKHHMDDEEDLVGVGTPQVAMIAVVGGLVGLWAAAAVRWLNGGDFQVFPPPVVRQDGTSASKRSGSHDSGSSSPSPRVLNLQQHGPQHPQEDTTTVDEEEEEDDDDDDASESDEEDDYEELDEGDISQYQVGGATTNNNSNKLSSSDHVLTQAMAQLATFSETMQQHVSVQQRILQKLSNNNNNNSQSVTDLSMQGLRQQRQDASGASNTTTAKTSDSQTSSSPMMAPMLWYKLVEIQVELAALKRTFLESPSSATKKDNSTQNKERSTELEARLGHTLVRLESVLKDLEEQRSPAPTDATEKTEETAASSEASPGSNIAPATKMEPAAIATDKDIGSKDGKTHSDLKGSSDASSDDNNDNNTKSKAAVSSPETERVVSQELTTEGGGDQHLRDLRQAVIDLVRLNADDPLALKAGTQVLFLYVSNLAKNPHLPRFRKVFTSNDSFKKVDRLKGGRDLLRAIGFVPSEDNRFLEWPPVEIEEDGTTPKALTTPEKEILVKQFHLHETASALTLLKSFSANKDTDAGAKEEATLSLVEKALEVLPIPPPLASLKSQAAGVEVPTVLPEQEPATDETEARWK